MDFPRESGYNLQVSLGKSTKCWCRIFSWFHVPKI